MRETFESRSRNTRGSTNRIARSSSVQRSRLPRSTRDGGSRIDRSSRSANSANGGDAIGNSSSSASALKVLLALALASMFAFSLASCAGDASRASDGQAKLERSFEEGVSDIIAPPEYLFDSVEKTVYLTEDAQLRSHPADDETVPFDGGELELIDVPALTELTLTGTNEHKYWRVAYDGSAWYVDSSLITEDAEAISSIRKRAALIEGNGEDLIVLGDSRTVGMRQSVSTNARLIGKVSMGYSWMMSTAIPQAEASMDEDSIVVFAFGVNDLGNVSRYISAMNDFKERHPGNIVCFLSVNPVDEGKCASYGYSASNSAIASFNSKMASELSGITYIDSYEHLMDVGFSTADGIHYTGATYKSIYDYMIGHVL